MKLSKAEKAKDYNTGKASDIARQLAFAGIAFIWIFKLENSGAITLPDNLQKPVILLVTCLTFDLLQYIYGAAAWGLFYRFQEKKLTPGPNRADTDIRANKFINWPSNFLFWGKLIAIAIAYFLLLDYSWDLLMSTK